MNDFVVFILSHGRADKVYTYDTLRKQGYTGRIVLVLDDEDEQRAKYEKNFGKENVEVFSKVDIAKGFDEMHKGDRRTIVYARNACFDIAKKLGYTYFIELDDDYTFFSYVLDDKLQWNIHGRSPNVRGLDCVFKYTLDYYKSIDCASIAFGQGGDYIGGKENLTTNKLKRKCMNSFLCSVERRFNFIGRINEDVNTYTTLGSRGVLFLSFMQFSLNQKQTQSNKGGMTEVYLDSGTYIKSFFSVMSMPSAVKIALMGGTKKRIHHQVLWNNCVPKIVHEKWKKRK